MVLSAASSILIDGFALHGFKQINGISNRNARFVLSNEAASPACTVSAAIEPLTSFDADHPALDVLLSFPMPIVFEDRTNDNRTLDFQRADYAEISAAISRIDWRPLDSADCVDDAVEFFNQMIGEIMTEATVVQWLSSSIETVQGQRATKILPKSLLHYETGAQVMTIGNTTDSCIDDM